MWSGKAWLNVVSNGGAPTGSTRSVTFMWRVIEDGAPNPVFPPLALRHFSSAERIVAQATVPPWALSFCSSPFLWPNIMSPRSLGADDHLRSGHSPDEKSLRGQAARWSPRVTRLRGCAAAPPRVSVNVPRAFPPDPRSPWL